MCAGDVQRTASVPLNDRVQHQLLDNAAVLKYINAAQTLITAAAWSLSIINYRANKIRYLFNTGSA